MPVMTFQRAISEEKQGSLAAVVDNYTILCLLPLAFLHNTHEEGTRFRVRRETLVDLNLVVFEAC